ncbi:MAG: beta-propeller domain-containing protein [Ilumatobacter sp.]|nr:beta-propeller domain-containing protein [Ilumatobacter sp.]
MILSAGLLTASACSADTPDGADVAENAIEGTDDLTGADNATRTDNTGLNPTRFDGPQRLAKVALRQFDECGAFLDYVHTEAVERVGAYGFDDQQYWLGMDDVMVMESDTAAIDAGEAGGVNGSNPSASDGVVSVEAAGANTDDESATDFSTTNVQVEGVDEPDIIKTDGARILALSEDGVMHYVDIDDSGGAGTKRGSISITAAAGLDGYFSGQEILVSGDRAFVIIHGGSEFPTPFPVDDVAFEESILTESLPGSGGRAGPTTTVVEVDLSNPDNLRIAGSLTLDGNYISARSIGDTARIAVTTPPTRFGFVFPSSPTAEESAAEANRELIRTTTVDDWVPGFSLASADGSQIDGPLVDCAGIYAPAEFAGFDVLSIVTLPMDQSLSAPEATTSVMATGDTVYASQDRMYIASNEWIRPTLNDQQRGLWEDNYQTGIHRFALPAENAAVYEASGIVDGHLLNQFSMHDRHGTFFVATTTGTPWSDQQSESQIVALQPNGKVLEQIGQVGGLGKGERIFSVRYVDDTAYVVTFRQTDPFYVVDLSVPARMVVRGELKIPGVSNYLHPISDTQVLGVGQNATEEGRQTGSKVSLFDVSNPSDPREVDVWTMPGASSDAEFDHRAFLWWAPTSTAVLPLVSWSEQFAGAVVLKVTENGIFEQGRIRQQDETEKPTGMTDCRVLNSEDLDGLDENDGELFWILQEPSSQFQLCGAEDEGGATGYSCEIIPVGELDEWFWTGDQNDLFIDLTGVDRIEWCWPDGGFGGYNERIQRTLVIGDQLWTMSPAGLQANDLATLDRTAAVAF